MHIIYSEMSIIKGGEDMKWLNTVLILALSVLIIGCCGKCGHVKSSGMGCKGGVCMANYGGAKTIEKQGHIDTVGLKHLIDSKVDVTILDARSGKYDDGRRIVGAKSLSYEATLKQAESVIPRRDSLIVTYCSNLKCPASAKLAKHLKELGYTNILEYSAGIEGWSNAGYEIEE